jgi:hypothetical protein
MQLVLIFQSRKYTHDNYDVSIGNRLDKLEGEDIQTVNESMKINKKHTCYPEQDSFIFNMSSI